MKLINIGTPDLPIVVDAGAVSGVKPTGAGSYVNTGESGIIYTPLCPKLVVAALWPIGREERRRSRELEVNRTPWRLARYMRACIALLAILLALSGTNRALAVWLLAVVLIGDVVLTVMEERR